MENAPEARRAGLARDAARLRLRRVTQLSVAVMVALGGTFAALAAGSTNAKKTVVRTPATRTPAGVVVQAPAPPLVGAQSAAPPPSAAPAPAPAPAPSSDQPVVVSGGS